MSVRMPAALAAAAAMATAAPASAVELTETERSIIAWASSYDWKFDGNEVESDSSSEPGPFAALVQANLEHYIGVPVSAIVGAP